MAADFQTIVDDCVQQRTCLQAVLSKPLSNDADVQKLSIRPVVIKGEDRYQWTSQFAHRQTHENLDATQTRDRIVREFGSTFAHCHLFTTTADYSARYDKGGRERIRKSRPTKSAATVSHNRAKNYLIPEGRSCPFLIEAGVMTPAGKVKAPQQHKFRQINRFLELVDDVVPHLPGDETLRVVDFGCGKSYLTFALHYLLTEIHERDVHIVGLDVKPDVINSCRQIARKLDCRGLEFQAGEIADYQTDGPVHLAVWLHACDTATDDALAQAVAWKTEVILAVPCCQHEFNSKLSGNSLPVVEQFGLLKERFAALATDALRAQVLEILGYQTQVVEFIELEHTAKNVLLRALRRSANDPSRPEKLAAYREFKNFLKIESPYLEKALAGHGISLPAF